MRFINRKTLALAGAAAALVAVGSTGTAVAGSLIGSADIKDGAVHGVDLSKGVNAKLAKTGAPGKGGKAAPSARLPRGELPNGGGERDRRLRRDEGPQEVHRRRGRSAGQHGGQPAASGFAVSSSFPGRMDWSTDTPKADRLDGWIVLGYGQLAPTR